jgi:hypothetical protein
MAKKTKKFALPAGPVRPLAENRGYCIASDMITVEGRKVGYMSREETADDSDSGWRFMSGRESRAYMDDATNFALYDVNMIANYEPDIVPLLDAPAGSSYERQGPSGRFAQIAGEPWEPGTNLGEVPRLTKDEFWAKLEEIGWLDAVTEAERKRLRTALAKAFKRDPRLAFSALAVISFDAVCIEGEGPRGNTYYTVLRKLARASRGKFAPTDIADELVDEEDVAQISFRHGGKVFSCEVPYEDDWFQRPVLDLVNKAMKAGKAREQFIPLPLREQTIALVLAPPALYKKAVRAGLIPQQRQAGG